MPSRVDDQLRAARDRLLDLTARNRLLNFRPTKRTTVRVIDESPLEVWRRLEEKPLAFLAREEHELFSQKPLSATKNGNGGDATASDGEGPEDAEAFTQPEMKTALGPGGQLPGHHTDLFLPTNLTDENLQTNLLRIEQAANSALEEQGVNFLFLAIGFLQWRPADNAEQIFKAPVFLIPVKLERTSAKQRFKLAILDEEPILNPCLVAKLKKDFRVEMPQPQEDWAEFDVQTYLESLKTLIADRPTWQVLDDIYLGLFSFTKYLMYLDLDSNRWPKDKEINNNRLIQTILDPENYKLKGNDLDGLPTVHDFDETLNPEEVFQVHDADSSQQQAILAAKSGRSLVIEGPPGTGKSQTITNIIAECLAAGRTVLFVSEKAAALDVVKRRLDKVGLGDFCLELHSTKSNRRSVLESLQRAINRSRSATAVDGLDRLVRLRSRLNSYVKALHEPFGPANLTPYRAMGRVVVLKDLPDVDCRLPGHETWDIKQVDDLKELVGQLARQMRAVNPPSEHPWRGTGITQVTAQLQRDVANILARLAAAIEKSTVVATQVSELLGVNPPADISTIKIIAASAQLVLASPGAPSKLTSSSLWDKPGPDLEPLLAKIKAFVGLQQWLNGRYDATAVQSVDWQGMLARCLEYWPFFSRLFRPAYHADMKAIKMARAPNHRPKFGELVADLRQLACHQALRRELDNAEELGRRYFDCYWQGPQSNWSEIQALIKWIVPFRSAARQGRIGQKGLALAEKDQDRTGLATAVGALREHLNAWGQAWDSLVQAVQVSDPGLFANKAEQTSTTEILPRLAQMAQRIESLFDWAQFSDALQACEKSPAANFVRAALATGIEPEEFTLAFEKQFLRLCMDDVMAQREVLRRFNGANHEADRLEFARLDRQWVAQSGNRLQAKLAAQQPCMNQNAARSSEVGILQGEFARVRGKRSIRRLLRDAGEAIQKLTPCFMMSPLSVAQFIDPVGVRFDVVVFDETSQVEPADALGAVARGDQLILVGDQNQLPPTNFFNTMGGDSEPSDSDDGAASITDMESILDRGCSIGGMPRLRLRWHYRSRHESLIAFSNKEFYQNDLVVFPSCHTDTEDLGLKMQYDQATLYDRGNSQTNRQQAQQIAKWVFDFAAKHPDKSLGVGAFSVRQQQAILDELEKLRRQDDSLEEFFDRNKQEPFFAKNLETIQGDERDVILLSIGYGKARLDERLSMNFGPLNKDGGWRRLNVLITRARERCLVFSSIRGEDFDLQATQARGVHSLKGYLEYARSGKLPEISVGQGEFGSPFEEAVYNALTEQNLELHRQVGCAGFAIDLAVVDRDLPGKYLLGIECDGATYHSSATARDRDRLRQQVLEDLGWRIHRIWSTDWFRTPQRELDRVMEAVRRAKSGQWKPALTDSASPIQPGNNQQAPLQQQEDKPAVPVETYKLFVPILARSPDFFYTDPMEKLADTVAQVVAVEGPIHEEQMMKRVADVWSLNRVGSRIEERIRRAMQMRLNSGKMLLKDRFLWPVGMESPPVRRRDHDSVRDIDFICPEEIGRASYLLLKAQYGMSRDDLVTQTARLLGFNNTGQRVSARIEEVLQDSISHGHILMNGDDKLKANSD